MYTTSYKKSKATGVASLMVLTVLTLNNALASNKPPRFSTTFIGGPTVILEIGGLRLMTDPTFDRAGSTYDIRGNNTVHKLTGPAKTDVGKIDIVLLSHDQHPDNLDSSGRAFLSQAGTTITTVGGAERLKGNAKGLSSWESLEFKSPAGDKITITATPARHGPHGIEKLAGVVTGFMISVEGAENYSIYVSGDTEYYSGIDEIAKRYQPEYAFVFAGAAQPTGPVNVTMGTNDVVEIARVFPKATIIPIHCEGWSHYTQHSTDYVKVFTALSIKERIQLLSPGIETVLKP